MKISNYNVYCQNNFLKFIDISKIEFVLELGCYDGNYTKEINHIYKPKRIISIDANPLNVKTILENQKQLTNVDFYNVALWSEETELDFHVLDLNGDLGSSSFFEHPNHRSNKIKLKTSTLDKFLKINNLKKIDIILADVEGAEAKIFKNQKCLHDVRYIICEAKFNKTWKGEIFPNVQDIKQSLEPFGFKQISNNSSPCKQFGDVLWINQNLK